MGFSLSDLDPTRRIKDPLGTAKDDIWLGLTGDDETPFNKGGDVGLAVDDPENRQADPQEELDELARAYSAYTTSSLYGGETPTWVQTPFGNMPIGGYTAQGPELKKDRMNPLWRDYAAARSQLLDRFTAQPKYDGGFSPDFGPRTFMPESEMSDQEIADMVSSYFFGTADYGLPDGGEQTPNIPAPQTETPQAEAPQRPTLDLYSGINPFAARAKSMGFTDFQDFQAPDVRQRAAATALREPTIDRETVGRDMAFNSGDRGGTYRGGSGRAVLPTPTTPNSLATMPMRLDNPGTLTQAMQAAALRGEGGQNG